jgi:predicted dehydrogenase
VGIRVGVVGTGRLGREHVRILKDLPGVDRVVCHDADPEVCTGVARAFGVQSAPSLDRLLDTVDAVCIVVPTSDHTTVALQALDRGKDLFIEKPIAAAVEDARRIVAAARAAGRIVQVGHVERFNPAFEASRPLIVSPSFMEIERLSAFTLRGTDVSVVMDLMIHDLDLVLLIVGEWPAEIRAKGAGVLTAGPDIVNVRLEFPGGCVANVTASRVSMEPSRMFRIFSPSHYVSIDLINKKVKYFKKSSKFYEKLAMLQSGGSAGRFDIGQFLDMDEFTAAGDEPLEKELRAFCTSVTERTEPPVTGEAGMRVLELAAAILSGMKMEPIP